MTLATHVNPESSNDTGPIRAPTPAERWRQLEAEHTASPILEGMFNSDVLGFTVFDLKTAQTIRANDYLLRLIGATREQFERGERGCHIATPPEWSHLDTRAIAEGQAKGSWAPFEKEFERPDGSRVPVRISSAAMPDVPGLVVVCIEDLSERKAAEQQLKLLRSEVNHLSRLSAMGTMASVLAHEVSQPLIAVSNALAMLEALQGGGVALGEARAAQALALAGRQTRRATLLLQRISTFSAPDRDAHAPIRLRAPIEDAAGLALMRMPGVVLGIAISRQAEFVRGDAIQVEQIILNLVRNAAEAMCGSGRIDIAARRRGHMVEISVADTGPGFGADGDRAFEAFATSKPNGTGLGLAICRELVERHGGTIRVDAKAEGGRVVFTLPHCEATQSPPTAPAPIRALDARDDH